MALKKLREMLDSKEISAVELTEQYLDRIENSDKEINSYITVCKENALADAKKAQEVIDSGNSGAFTGLPISVKDNICTLGVKTTCASHMLDDFIPPYNATVMEKLKKDNIVMLGKTNMDEFAMGGSSQTSYFGGVKNPYDLTRVTGGSSGGAAASVSADLHSVRIQAVLFVSLLHSAVLQVLNRHTALFQDGDLSHSHLHLTKSALSQSLPKTQAICLRAFTAMMKMTPHQAKNQRATIIHLSEVM